MAKDDWRRENVNNIVRRVYQEVKAAKSWVKVGIAPFGIWRNGVPAGIKGEDAYSILYTDSQKWLAEGWLDYCSPQLYWPMGEPLGKAETSFPVLLNWWREQNVKHRNLWPGLNTVKVGEAWPSSEILAEIRTARDQLDGAAGEIHFSAHAIVNNQGGIATALARDDYAKPALVPASPWLEEARPGKPTLRVENGQAMWQAAAGTPVSVWLWQVRMDGKWQTWILGGTAGGIELSGSPEVVAVTEIDRCGLAGPAAVLQRAETGPKQP